MKKTETTPLGKQMVVSTDPAGRVTSQQVVINPPLQLSGTQVPLVPTFYKYDLGRLSKVIRGTSDADLNRREITLSYVTSTTLQDYGGLRQVQTTAGSPQIQVNVTHDSMGRVLTVSTFDTTSGISSPPTKFAWDVGGNLKTLVTPTNQTHKHDYTALGELASYMPPVANGGGDTRYTYNADRNLEAEFQPGGAVVSTVYDQAKGRPTSMNFSGGAFNYTYYPTDDAGCAASPGCARGKLQSIVGSAATPYAANVNFFYDSMLLTKSTVTDANGTLPNGVVLTHVGPGPGSGAAMSNRYDAFARMTPKARPTPPILHPDGGESTGNGPVCKLYNGR